MGFFPNFVQKIELLSNNLKKDNFLIGIEKEEALKRVKL